jgi:hypothetical protein
MASYVPTRKVASGRPWNGKCVALRVPRILFVLFAVAPAFFANVTRGSCADADAARLDAPPPVIPTTARLADILSANRRAAGVRPAGEPDTVVEHWAFIDSGLAGTEDLQRSGTDYRSRIVQGPFVDEYGQYGQTRWHQDANGFTSPTTGIDLLSFYATRVLNDAADPKNDASVLGETSGPKPAYVVQVKRPGYKHPEFLFYDKSSAQIVRAESVVEERRLIQTFDDFRTTHGLSRAWHIHDTDGRPELDDDWHLQSVDYGTPIAPSVFSMPPNQSHISTATTVTPIPARTLWLDYFMLHVWAGFLVRVDVAGRGLDFLIDSAVSRSIIDSGVAREMNLPTYGQTTRLPDGTGVSYRTMIAQASVGGIALNNFVVDAEPFGYEPDDATKIVGVLGYDFFAANVLRFDFPNGRLDAMPIGDFDQVNPVPGGIDIPLTIDDGTLLVSLGIGNAVTHHAVLSTTMPISLLFGSFVAAHPEEVRDVKGKAHGTPILPLADAGTYGVKLEDWSSLVSHFRFAVSDYQQVGIETTNFPLELHDEPVDAVVAADYLGYYDLYFDYPYGRLIVKPNAVFYKTFKPGG